MPRCHSPVSILYKSIAGRYRPVRVADGPITARYRFIKNASWEVGDVSLFGPTVVQLVVFFLSGCQSLEYMPGAILVSSQ